jgi:hypothetical protein
MIVVANSAHPRPRVSRWIASVNRGMCQRAGAGREPWFLPLAAEALGPGPGLLRTMLRPFMESSLRLIGMQHPARKSEIGYFQTRALDSAAWVRSGSGARLERIHRTLLPPEGSPFVLWTQQMNHGARHHCTALYFLECTFDQRSPSSSLRTGGRFSRQRPLCQYDSGRPPRQNGVPGWCSSAYRRPAKFPLLAG